MCFHNFSTAFRFQAILRLKGPLISFRNIKYPLQAENRTILRWWLNPHSWVSVFPELWIVPTFAEQSEPLYTLCLKNHTIYFKGSEGSNKSAFMLHIKSWLILKANSWYSCTPSFCLYLKLSAFAYKEKNLIKWFRKAW